MSNEKTGGYAYPAVGDSNTPGGAPYPFNEGMTLLDHFAGLAMQGIMGNSDYADSFQPSQSMAHEGIASHAYKLASAMIAERNRLMNP